MSAHVINGKELVGATRAQIKEEAARLTAEGRQPGLTVILVGDNPASAVYVRNKIKSCEEVGIRSSAHLLPVDTSEEKLLSLIDELNRDPNVHGILVQEPLPPQIREEKVNEAISPLKDVDCFHPINVGNLILGKEGFLPCTPAGVIEILKRSGVTISGKHAVVIGRSKIVGKPMSMLLLRENATVTICHSRTPNMADITRQADILVAAVGKAKLIGPEYVKPGAIVIDVGMNRLDTGKLCGDVDFDAVLEKAGMITPVPGCVGPMTITMLLQNTVTAAKMAGRPSVQG